MFNYWLKKYKQLRHIDGDVNCPLLAKEIKKHIDTEHEIFTDGYSFITFIKADDNTYKDDYGNIYTLQEIKDDNYQKYGIFDEDINFFTSEHVISLKRGFFVTYPNEKPSLHLVTQEQINAEDNRQYDLLSEDKRYYYNHFEHFRETYTVRIDNLGYLKFQLNNYTNNDIRDLVDDNIESNFTDYRDLESFLLENPYRKIYDKVMLLYLPKTILYEQLKQLGMEYTGDGFMDKYQTPTNLPPTHTNEKIALWKQTEVAEGQLSKYFNNMRQIKVHDFFLKEAKIDVNKYEECTEEQQKIIQEHLHEQYDLCEITQEDIDAYFEEDRKWRRLKKFWCRSTDL